MKKFNLITITTLLICFVLLQSCPKNRFSAPIAPVLNNDSNRCHNIILAALIKPGDLKTVLATGDINKIYLQFKTSDDHNFYPAAFVHTTTPTPYSDVSSYFKPFNRISVFLPTKPYILGNLEWSFSTGFQPDMTLSYYCIYPVMSDDNVHVSYTYIPIPSTFIYKDSTINVDTAFISHAQQPQTDSLVAYSLQVNFASGNAINPIPPKKPQ